ncbi:DNA-3-methyladenine glycosylase I [Burkholderia orbicola]|uniref:DNA-3-methyladenine glycosylase I n=1 Tax=Burkholderia cepacia complex TaxID=87882 RepID=UPI001CF4EB91|nr:MULTISPECIES: DNA-3-methyladenine glycosylase I [Burkholderia cepacia complex]MCA7921739.1 DNA-3-methyladenine glycosylase I [Burkholderia cenocepacia]MDN7466455.1 DNA-3-methyladenine glycosylase I [Burkholderia orbicola]MDN7501920.1 DNA-3-methyladenine glycosylase I [Burkholderia orbicola]MDS0806432.1 DNA-3-methyladenine glycosylase I [Burkholderia cenocepacia]
MQRTIDKRPVTRCEWADGDPPMQAYHDHEWGVPARGALGLVVDNRVQVDDSPHVSGAETVVRHVTTPIAGT